jgi:hypothetical protein
MGTPASGNIPRFLSMPLIRRHRKLDPDALVSALRRVDERVLGEELLVLHQDVLGKAPRSWQDVAGVKQAVTLALALYSSRRISTQEYVFYATTPVNMFHEHKWTNGEYEPELGPIMRSIDQVRREHGLDESEEWVVGEGPADYQRLNSEYEEILDRKLLDALRESVFQTLRT